MEQTSLEHKGGLRVGGNCVDIGLSLARDCLQEEKERFTNSSIATRYGREENSVETVIKQEEAATGATMVEGMRRPTAVSFLDWRPKDEHVALEKRKGESERGLDRMGSGVSFLSGYGGGGEGTDAGGDDLRRFNEGQVKLPWAQYKGVVPQPIGRWTAQIYDSHQREREEDAARAYDTAVLKFWGHDTTTNFKPTEEGAQGHSGSRFLSDHHEVQVVDMLRKRTYEEEELDSRKKTTVTEEDIKEGTTGRPSGDGGGREDEDDNKKKEPCREHMFDKAVTPSDVGKLNRLVIPKQHAEKYFPLDTSANEKGLLLNFEDNTGKAWRFRYSYWNSSQSYVLTKGWSRFVKEKKLDAGDIVSFERGTDHNVQRLFISWRRRPSAALHPPFADPSKALLPGLPSLARPHIQYTNTPFQSHALHFRAAAGATLCQGQGQVVPSSLFKPFPQLMSLVWSANGDEGGGGGGASSRATAEMWAEQMNVNARARAAHPHPQPMDVSLNNDSKPARRFIEFESSRRAADVQNSLRAPLDFMRAPELPPETKTGTSFDSSTSKKGVRLFGVNL